MCQYLTQKIKFKRRGKTHRCTTTHRCGMDWSLRFTKIFSLLPESSSPEICASVHVYVSVCVCASVTCVHMRVWRMQWWRDQVSLFLFWQIREPPFPPGILYCLHTLTTKGQDLCSAYAFETNRITYVTSNIPDYVPRNFQLSPKIWVTFFFL